MELTELIKYLKGCMQLNCRTCPFITKAGCQNYLMGEAVKALEGVAQTPEENNSHE